MDHLSAAGSSATRNLTTTEPSESLNRRKTVDFRFQGRGSWFVVRGSWFVVRAALESDFQLVSAPVGLAVIAAGGHERRFVSGPPFTGGAWGAVDGLL